MEDSGRQDGIQQEWKGSVIMSGDSSIDSGIRPKLSVETGVSRYDIVNGALVSSIALVGFLTTMLFLIWLTTILEFNSEATAIAAYEQPFGDEKPEGYEDDVLEPGVEEFPEVEEPVLKDALEAVTDAVSSVRANLEAVDGDSEVMGSGRGRGSIDGGDGTGGGDVIPEYKRWKIEYKSSDIGSYAKQLSFFNIDIGAVSINSNEIDRVRDAGGAMQVIASDRAKEKKSIYFAHEKQKLRRWDARLVTQAGVSMDGRNTVQFYPNETRGILRQVEGEYLQSISRTLPEVRRTFFQIVEDGGGFKFKVTKVEFRRR